MATSAKHAATPEDWPKNGDDYVLGEVIGVGSSAIVHTAYCTPRNEVCAIKRIKLETLSGKMERLEEIQYLANWNHKYVVKLYTSFVVDDEFWLVMMLFNSGSLLDIMRYKQEIVDCTCGIFDEATIATVLKMVLEALEYIHGNGQIHGDIKAENIFLNEEGIVQIAGFGMSMWLAMGGDIFQQMQKKLFGRTAWHLQPKAEEEAKNDDIETDIWSVGITALELVTGKSFYDIHQEMSTFENYSAIADRVENVIDQHKNYGKYMGKMIALCLQKDQKIRPTAKELLKHSFFKQVKSKQFDLQALLMFAPFTYFRFRNLQNAKTRTTAWVFESGSGEWVWGSNDEKA